MSELNSKEKMIVPRSLMGFAMFTGQEIYRRKKWILLPAWVLLAALALLIFLGGGSSLLPAIYLSF